MENTTKKVPELRFPGFTDDWEQRKVEEYASFLTGNGLNWDDISDEGEQECILYGNLYTDYGMITDKINYRTDAVVKNPVYSEYGDVLIPASDTTPTGLARAISLEKSGVLLGGDINIIRPNGNVDGSCLSLVLNANKKELIRLIKGTTVRHIHNSEIKNVVVSLPKSKDEQQTLSRYFKKLDHLITLHQRKCEELKIYKKGMLQKMFPQPGETKPQIRFPGFTEDWEQRKLGDFCDMYNGDRSAKYPNENDMVPEGIPFINAGDLENGHVNLDTANKITREKYIALGGAKLQLGDIVYCLRGTLGKNAFIDNFSEGTVASSLVAIRPNNINGRYLFHVLNSEIEYKQRVVRDEGAAQPNLSAKSVSEFIIPIPDIIEQKTISYTLDSLCNLITLHQRKCEELKEYKKGLLQKMFV